MVSFSPVRPSHLPSQAQDACDAARETLQAQFVNGLLVQSIGQLTPCQILQHCLLAVRLPAWHLQEKYTHHQMIARSQMIPPFTVLFFNRLSRLS